MSFNELKRKGWFWIILPPLLGTIGGTSVAYLLMSKALESFGETAILALGVSLYMLIFSYPVMLFMAFKAKKLRDLWINLSLAYVFINVLFAIAITIALLGCC